VFTTAIDTVTPRGGPAYKREDLWQSYKAAMLAFQERPFLGARSQASSALLAKEGVLALGEPTHDQFEWLTYGQVYERALQLATGLTPFLPEGSFVGIFGQNSCEWVVADLACTRQHWITAPIDVHQSQAAVGHIIGNTAMRLLISSAALLQRVVELEPRQWQKLRYVLVMPGQGVAMDASARAQLIASGLEVLMWDELLKKGSEGAAVEEAVIDPDSLFTLTYTSGSTGLPKGVMFSHRVFNGRVCFPYTLINPLVCIVYCTFAHFMDRYAPIAALYALPFQLPFSTAANCSLFAGRAFALPQARAPCC
jgi:long-subunit acyl-CoA synthetase (AMP-forming)